MKQADNINNDRSPVASGRFYSENKDQLEQDLEALFDDIKEVDTNVLPDKQKLQCLISPHAGFVFSGKVAASAFQQLKDTPLRKRIFLIGSSHCTYFNGASIYNCGHYQTPLGKVEVDITLANKLINNSSTFNYIEDAHSQEHSLEVQLPFLQYLWKDKFKIIPIIISTNDSTVCKIIANELAPYFTPENLFIVSTDLSHYPEYYKALEVDAKTVKSVISGKPKNLLDQLKKNEQEGIANLATSMCGWTSVLTTMYLTERIKSAIYTPIMYRNSGDAEVYGSKDKVVGYQSIAITAPDSSEENFKLSDAEKQILLDAAKDAIQYYQRNKKRSDTPFQNVSEKLLMPGGAFVSIYYDDELFGCIGRMHSQTDPLIEIISDVAVSAAFFDSRFNQLTPEQLIDAQIEISVLTPLKKIQSIDEIVLGKHGIYISKDYMTGTFLPQVADKTNWTVEEFLGHCSQDKARIGWDGWKDADVFTYEAIVFRA